MKRHDPPTYLLDSNFGEKLRVFGDEFVAFAKSRFSNEMSRVCSYVQEYRKNPIQDGFTWGAFPEEFYFAELTTIAILNKALWDDFCRADHTVIFIPDCLSLMKDKCKRKGVEYMEQCDRCVPNCAVNKIVSLKENFEFFEVFTYREMKDQFKVLKDKFKSVSFFGVACILMLAEGMRSSMADGVPAHGVPLAYCGCEHWAKEPFPTDTDLAEIERVLALKAEYRRTST
jgi:hypothetical protein